MDFLEAIPITFKEITPNQKIPEKWKEIVLNTGGTHSTLQDIKPPPKAGGYWYNQTKKSSTRNRFIYWQTTPDAIELSEASLDLNLSSANLRCKVAPGTPPINGMTVWEQTASKELIILAATVSSVHRFIFPHPETLDQKATFGSLSGTTPSIFYDTKSINNPNNYYILNQYSSASTGIAHTCASLLRGGGEAVYALAYGSGGEGGIQLVRMPAAGPAITYQLKRESTVPRFLSGITGALRGKGSEGIETYGVALTGIWAVAVCGDTCLRAWPLSDGGAPAVVSPPLTQTQIRPKPPPHGHMLQKSVGADGGVLLVVYLSFPSECEFVVLRLHDGAGGVRFSNICRIYGPQLDLLDYTIGYGEGTNVIWALWSQSDGETVVTSSSIGAEAGWRCVAGRSPPPALPQLSSHQQYRDRLLAVGLFPPSVVRKALVIYRRTWGGHESGGDNDLGESAVSAVQARVRHLAARTNNADNSHLMHKCWSDLYSWCLQYMEGLQKPLGIMVSKQVSDSNNGWWAAVIRRAGISLVRELEPLERILLSSDVIDESCLVSGELSSDALRVVAAGAAWERRAGEAAAAELERRVFACAAPQHRLLPRLLHLPPVLTPQQIDELTSILEPIKDLQSAVLELNDALRLDVPEIDTSNEEDESTSEYENLFSSELGVSIVTEAIRQMAEMRSRIVRGALSALGLARGADAVPGAGHCAVHWQAYRALLWLRAASEPHQSTNSEELFRLKLGAVGLEAREASDLSSGVVHAYVAARGAKRARAQLAVARAPPDWQHALPLVAYHVAHQLWAVSGGFEFGCWLAGVNRPRLVQSYVSLLEPWCEWNACSRQFILGLALLDLEDAEGAYTAFSRAAKGVGSEPFLRRLVEQPGEPLTQHRALVIYYMKVIKLFEIHDAGACLVRLAETAISIADKDDPNLAMFQWVVFKWHLAGGRVERALSAAAASAAPHARAAAAATLLTTLAGRKQLGALVSCGALAADAERAAAARAKLHDAHTHNPYYDFLYALHINRQHYRKAAAVMYERAARCGAEGGAEGVGPRRQYLAAALTALRLARPEHAFLARPAANNQEAPQVIGPEELAAEFREEDPDSMDPIKQALLTNENIDFDVLYPYLKEAGAETLLDVTRRAIGAAQTLPHWFLQRFLAVDSSSCVRALLAGGRAVEAARWCGTALRSGLRRMTSTAPDPPRSAPLAVADLLRLELRQHLDDDLCREAYEDLEEIIKEYTDVVVRTSEDKKLAQIKFPVASS